MFHLVVLNLCDFQLLFLQDSVEEGGHFQQKNFLRVPSVWLVPLREHSQGQLNRQPRMLLTAARLFFPEDAFFEFEGCLLPTCFRWEDAVSDLAVVSSSSEDREGIAVSSLPSLN